MTDAEIEELVIANNAVNVEVPLSALLMLARVDQWKMDIAATAEQLAKLVPGVTAEEVKSAVARKNKELDDAVEFSLGEYVKHYETWAMIGKAFDGVFPKGTEEAKGTEETKEALIERTYDWFNSCKNPGDRYDGT